ncbi:hypothetical protein [uncultured Dysgonomonas sp.]|uniref:Uncharacterized protein n=1 Tax=uncultured Dysgonomonas sp. TaxID=206096 RepID=A0A212IXL7_9BACT|nr:hypothetical protein [uncultured Dysgonomonas sp.]SBV91922.1 conserved hypothetical protein [uncultured Dysgonomonas sp.]
MNKPDTQAQKELLSINSNGKDVIEIPRTKDRYKVGWIRPFTTEKLSLLELNSGIEATNTETDKNVKGRAKILSKAASYIILNGVSIFFFHWLVWRYFYYIKGYSFDQLLPIIEKAKKKVPQVKLYLGLTLVSHMKITNPTLTKEEADQFQAELSSALNLPLEKNMDGL